MSIAPTQTLEIPRPDDWHAHLRDDAILRAVAPITARYFARAVVMPNLAPPVVTTAQAKEYRERIYRALPPHTDFRPLMTAYLTDTTDPDDLTRGFEEGALFAAKLYPAGATTNAENGVTDIQVITPILEKMQRLGMPLLIHGEVTDPSVDIFDREVVFIDRVLTPLRRSFAGLKIVLEHVTTRYAVHYVASESTYGNLLAATITPHHLWISRNALFDGGLRPHHYCLPVVKHESDRQTLIQAATSGSSIFFAGTDTAPHPRRLKESACGSAGIFSAPGALALYAEVFERAGALDKLADFLSLNGAAFYDLPVNSGTIQLEKLPVPEAPLKPILTDDGEELVAFPPDSSLSWRVAASQP